MKSTPEQQCATEKSTKLGIGRVNPECVSKILEAKFERHNTGALIPDRGTSGMFQSFPDISADVPCSHYIQRYKISLSY